MGRGKTSLVQNGQHGQPRRAGLEAEVQTPALAGVNGMQEPLLRGWVLTRASSPPCSGLSSPLGQLSVLALNTPGAGLGLLAEGDNQRCACLHPFSLSLSFCCW